VLLAARNRPALLNRAGGIFEKLKNDLGVTHMYFSGPDRVNLLRVHSPGRHGDVIDRITTMSASQNGTTAYGVELGPLGTLTLRLVSPWYDIETGQLIGFVELGMEIDRALNKIREFFGVEVFVLVRKSYLERKLWEEGMRAMGRAPFWDRYPEAVISGHSPQKIPPVLIDRLAREGSHTGSGINEVRYGDAIFRLAFLPLDDAGGNHVAHMVLVTDVSKEMRVALNTVYAGSLVALVVGFLLLGFFYWQVGRIGRRIEGDERALEELATHDGLTGLYNHRTFYTLLEDEIGRARRYKRQLTIFMIDIDHFKSINDTHGHLAGDAILRDLSKLLTIQVRGIDRVCRYGGEEFVIILPEMGKALDAAERLREAIEATPFDTGSGKRISITASIGVASYPGDAEDLDAVVAAADSALYAAKRGGRNRVCCSERT